MPRGADAVLMIEYTDVRDEGGELLIEVHRPVAPGEAVAAAGGDIARGETVLRAGQVLSSREIGSLAAIGFAEIPVWRKPRVAIFSTGDELVAPGQPARPDRSSIQRRNPGRGGGGTGRRPGAVRHRPRRRGSPVGPAAQGLESDMVLLSGGTSKGAGDMAYHVVAPSDPGIVVHGVALKPGKPICLAVTGGKPVVILPGFPDLGDVHLPRIRRAGDPRLCRAAAERRETLSATLPMSMVSELGRTEYVMVSLCERPMADSRPIP